MDRSWLFYLTTLTPLTRLISRLAIHRIVALLTLTLGVSLGVCASAYANPSSFVPAPPALAAKSYILIDAISNQVIVEENADRRLPPASLTKIMTDYIAAHELSNGNIAIDDQVLISIKAWRKGGSKMYIREGERVSVEDLLKGIVIQSGNDASIALAEHIAGSEQAFAGLMNIHAQNLGMVNSNFQNATGWPADDHYTTARDMAILTQALIARHPDNYQLYKLKEFTFNNIRQPNRNLLLWRDSSVDGVKTGHTEEAGYGLVSSAVKNGTRLIAVVLGTKSAEARATESLKLLNYGFRFFETHTTYRAQQTINEAPVWMGETDIVKLGIEDDVIITVARGKRDNLSAAINIDSQIHAPVARGATYGNLVLSLDGEVVAERPLVALNDVNPGSFFKRLWHWLYLFFSNLF